MQSNSKGDHKTKLLPHTKFCETMSRQQVQKPLAMSLLLLFPSPLKVAQNSQKHPEYESIVRDKVSPLERAAAADAASSPSMALPPHTLPGLTGNIHTGKKLSVLKAWPPA